MKKENITISADEYLDKMLHKLQKNQKWGTYYLGKFYFTIVTNITKQEAGISDETMELSYEQQLKLQRVHYPALFHEYIHYLHELSTVIGNVSSMLSLVERSLFSHHFDPDLGSSLNFGLRNTPHMDTYSKVIATQYVLNGDANEMLDRGKMIEVLEIDKVSREIFFPEGQDIRQMTIEIPRIRFSYFDQMVQTDGVLDFGKYFIYEGIAYELDRIVEMNVSQLSVINDTHAGTEYTVLRRIAHFIYPGISTRNFVTLASLSLQYIDCGTMFIQFIRKLKIETEMGISEDLIMNGIKTDTSNLLLSKQSDFNGAHDEVVQSFHSRESLHRAFTFIADQCKHLYQHRILSPSFEVDLVFENRQWDILTIANICNYMYIFKNQNEFKRDFLGTSIDQETAKSLQILLSYADYYTAHRFRDTISVEKEQHCCPYYYTCPLNLRREFAEICQTKPWRIFEHSFATDKQYCWYGNGVGEFKGHTKYRL